jgi:hypothetical protein
MILSLFAIPLDIPLCCWFFGSNSCLFQVQYKLGCDLPTHYLFYFFFFFPFLCIFRKLNLFHCVLLAMGGVLHERKERSFIDFIVTQTITGFFTDIKYMIFDLFIFHFFVRYYVWHIQYKTSQADDNA